MNDTIIKIENVKKQYRLGLIGGGTLRGDLQSWWARIRGKDDPNLKIGAKVYKKNEKFMALDGIDLEIKQGERVGIIGHNGAGKSTLLKLLSRVTAPSEGEISINGRISSMLEVGTGFHGELTGRENIYLNGAILGMTRGEVSEKIDQIIEFSECGQFIDTPVKRYSSGMYVKLAFSVAAHLDSEILIMDEVLAVGDMAFQQKCINKMNEVSQEEGRTILYVSHNMNTIRQLCDRCVVLDSGKIVFDGDVETAIEHYDKNLFETVTERNYTQTEHSKYTTNEVQILSAKYIDKSTPVFKDGEKQIIELKLKYFADLDETNLRIIFYDHSNSPVATALTSNFYAGNENDVIKAYIGIDTKNFAPGKYKTLYVLYTKNILTQSSINHDRVNGLSFIIQRETKLIWPSRGWGNIELEEPKVKITK